MASCEVSSLIKFLQNFGGDVISGQSKFIVTPKILKEINEITQSVNQDIYASPISNTALIKKYSNNDNDYMFLYDFVQKTPKLKISNTVSSHDFAVNVSDFNNLKYLELYKFNVKYVRGIQLLRENLEMVVCVRCLDKVGDLLNSDNDAYITSVSSIWTKLRHAVLSRNNLISLDNSFIHTPWLQYLDLSYNNLRDIRQLTCLRNLTHLNVSYNRLTEIPEFPMYKLRVLILNNNYVSDITGISSLESLQECNLSSNCISDHAKLLPLADLSWLQSVNIQGNPLVHHPMHRSLTCGYLHENVANKHFLLDNRPISSAEREFIRYSSRRSGSISSKASSVENMAGMGNPLAIETHEPEPCEILRKVRSREAKIDDSLVSADSSDYKSADSSVITLKDEESNDEDIIALKKQMKAIREERGPDFYLLENLFKIEHPNKFTPEITPADIERVIILKKRNDISRNEGSSSDTNSRVREIDRSGTSNDNVVPSKVDSDDKPEQNLETTYSDSDITSASESCLGLTDDEETSELHYTDIAEKNLWVVHRILDKNDKRTLFLILDDSELKEIDPVKQNIITQWSTDCIERCVKISNDPCILKLTFDVLKRDNRQRTFIMEYADAQKLIRRIDSELESRYFKQMIHLRCMKCDVLFGREIPKRSDGCDPPIYACTSCNSTAVLQEDFPTQDTEKLFHSKDTSTSSKSAKNEPKAANVTQSPSLSSIGSAASLDQNADSGSNDVSQSSHQESDIEVISNPSESSVEVIYRETNRPSMAQRLSGKLPLSEISSGDPSSVSAAITQILTESSSSGSMTDSSCTTIESNYMNRGPQRVSQSTVDETLLEESSSSGTSPQQRDSAVDTSTTTISVTDLSTSPKKNGTTIWNNVSGVLETVSRALLSSSIPRKHNLDVVLSEPFEYSYTDFASVDHRIKLYFWDQITVQNEEISAFVRVNAILKIGGVNQPQFPGLVFFTSKQMYLVRMTNKEIDENPNSWLQKYESVVVEKIKLIKPVLWKQGFSVHTDDRSPSGKNVVYVVLLYDQKRTDRFLSFLKDCGIVHVQVLEDDSERRELIRSSRIHDDTRNLTVADSIVVRHDNGGDEIHYFVALVVTSEEFYILKVDDMWSSSSEVETPTILRQVGITDLVDVEKTENGISLQFINETDGTEMLWLVSTVTRDSTDSIINAIREPWEKVFDVQLPVSLAP